MEVTVKAQTREYLLWFTVVPRAKKKDFLPKTPIHGVVLSRFILFCYGKGSLIFGTVRDSSIRALLALPKH